MLRMQARAAVIVTADTVTVRVKRDAVQLRSGTTIVDARA